MSRGSYKADSFSVAVTRAAEKALTQHNVSGQSLKCKTGFQQGCFHGTVAMQASLERIIEDCIHQILVRIFSIQFAMLCVYVSSVSLANCLPCVILRPFLSLSLYLSLFPKHPMNQLVLFQDFSDFGAYDYLKFRITFPAFSLVQIFQLVG